MRFALSDVDADSRFEAERADAVGDRPRCADRPRGTIEGRDIGVDQALGIQLHRDILRGLAIANGRTRWSPERDQARERRSPGIAINGRPAPLRAG